MHQDGRRWYVIQCKPREDARAMEHLRNQSYEAFQPLLPREQVRQGRRQLVSEPLFPGYVFVRLSDVDDNWAPLRSTRGVARLVRFGGVPAVLPDTVMELILARLEAVAATPRTLHESGQTVQIASGPFAGVSAVFSAYDGEARAIVMLRLLQQMQTVSLPLDQIAKQDT